ncbi:MAG: 4-hydroxythreonine-4-phosphate dehydrogenase PdxA [Hyphomicrobiaceae bacterium]|nr:4-hydroxythreonine-4-phosphate dehydrogenase PdxA [Hyphomicrobiaceae bacterium]
MGDPAGISPELTARLLADAEVRAAASLVVFGDRRVLAEGERVAGIDADIPLWTAASPAVDMAASGLFVDIGHLDPASIALGVASANGGRFALANFRAALRLAAAGCAGAVAFTPFNKHAMRQALPGYEDEIAVVTETIGAAAHGREFNVLGRLWNARVTSHVPLRRVADLITRGTVLNALELTDRCMRGAGFERPRIAVAALNPHSGDGGNFGREEIEVIGPAVAEAKARGIACEGPFPSDTVFLRARRGDFDAVQTMFHDQGQIAMKLMGFEEGITLIGGYPFPVCTPAHGTAYDIAGKGIANPGASRQAVLVAARMAARRTLERGQLHASLAEICKAAAART